MINHFNFKRVDKNHLLLTNDFGQHVFLSNDDFHSFALNENKLPADTRAELEQKHFLLDPLSLYSRDLLYRLRDMKSYVFTSTSLHIFVVTNACNLRCIYCQAQAEKVHKNGFMDFETGKRAIDIALQSPSNNLTFEFQGGEPLMNFPVIKQMIEYTEGVKNDKNIEYTIVSNLSLLTDEMVDFFIEHRVSLSTSLDGPQGLHDYNRRHCGNESSYECAINGIQKVRAKNYFIGAIQTTTRASLSQAREIVRQYISLGMNGIFLRPLTPLGFAQKDWESIGYSAEEFLEFYRTAFDEILKVNREGYYFPEQHATIFLKKILKGYAVNYLELRSPCGAALGQLAYYYDGNVYTCDEARMVAEAGNNAFCLGNVYDNDYSELIGSGTCKATCASSVLESLPGCCDCVYQPYCGTCPVVNYASDGDIFAKNANNYRCQVYAGILDYLFMLLRKNDDTVMTILKSWVEEN